MSKEIEIELTYLAAFLPLEIRNSTPLVLEDTYIPETEKFAVLRLRRKSDTYEITKKSPSKEGDYSQHVEHTISLTKDEYDALYVSSNKRLQKMRYRVVIDGHEADVDVFGGALTGLVLIDFEFLNRDKMTAFRAPNCCLKDVTQERTILGGQLAGKDYEDIKSWLDEQGYKKIV